MNIRIVYYEFKATNFVNIIGTIIHRKHNFDTNEAIQLTIGIKLFKLINL